ncbi:ABC transporter ATP-binding protein [Ciceribacter sp. L1K22]|uniref:energy-coupling factor ABC transporter ATP-binding protein n=1 Tax=Ciceribacter sp. L1K22 TaxID=2820275 RepID=UPI001ABE9824|nr:ABC transporter ATP-binding protein [Ciceribacter sp. L1K22]MBO3759134.1 ABC transporter ATP-binding protein [Ciceribacter sp. L1K22]
MNITFDAATLTYDRHTALEPLSLTLVERRIGVIGLNGSGKTSFARLIVGLSQPTKGRVLLAGLDTVVDAEALRGRTGFIFQHPANQIVLPIIGDDVALGLKGKGFGKAEIVEKVEAVLSKLGIAHLQARRPHELSGGELQLAALAAVLVTEPDVVIFDEPTNQLDLKNRAQVERAVAGLDSMAIVISHDLALVEGFDRVLVFDRGALAFDGEPLEAIQRYREIARR